MEQQLVPGQFLRRYKRFFADVRLESGEEVVAHCPNTGTMKTLLEEGAEAWLRHSSDPKRKLAYSLVLLGVPGGRVGDPQSTARALVDTALPNGIVAEAIEAGKIPSLAGYRTVRREVKVGEKSRIDLVLEDRVDDGHAPPCFIEVKNVTMLGAAGPSGKGSRADFPDAVTERGRKHLGELRTLVEAGNRAVQLFFLGREDCDRVGVAEAIDPAYAETLRSVVEAGVEVVAVRGEHREEGEGRFSLIVGDECPVDLTSSLNRS